MSDLKVYWPDECEFDNSLALDDEPAILPFRNPKNRITAFEPDPLLERARALHNNRVCPHCQLAAVQPIELQDAILNRNFMPIPGTATLVGFHCNGCLAEWPAFRS